MFTIEFCEDAGDQEGKEPPVGGNKGVPPTLK